MTDSLSSEDDVAKNRLATSSETCDQKEEGTSTVISDMIVPGEAPESDDEDISKMPIPKIRKSTSIDFKRREINPIKAG